jgi:hypothetical protein
MVNISHVVGVVSGYMENPSETLKWVFLYFRSTKIIYKGDEHKRCKLIFKVEIVER